MSKNDSLYVSYIIETLGRVVIHIDDGLPFIDTVDKLITIAVLVRTLIGEDEYNRRFNLFESDLKTNEKGLCISCRINPRLVDSAFCDACAKEDLIKQAMDDDCGGSKH